MNALGEKRVSKIYELADVYHSDNIERVSDDFIEAAGITRGDFDNVALAKYSIPSHWDLGKVYKRLILGIAREKQVDVVTALFMAYNSYLTTKIEDLNSSLYYENPQYIMEAYITGVLE